MWGLRVQIDQLRKELDLEKRSKGQAVRTIKRLGRENKRLRDAIELAIGACTCRAIEPCEGCELLRSHKDNLSQPDGYQAGNDSFSEPE
jgi:hypothetical protein